MNRFVIFSLSLLMCMWVGANLIHAARSLGISRSNVTYNPWTNSTLTLDPGLTLSNDGQLIVTVNVQFSLLLPGDVVTVNAGVLSAQGLVATYDPSTYTYSIYHANGSGRPADKFQAVLRTLAFYVSPDATTYFRNSYSLDATASRNATIVVLESGVALELTNGNFHIYDFVAGNGTSAFSWSTARENALKSYYYGMQGYLATITSSAENAFLRDKANDVVWGAAGWLGGSDNQALYAQINGVDRGTDDWWFWVDGPERGKVFFKDAGYTSGDTMLGFYSYWHRAGEPGDEPNGSNGGEDYLQMLGTDVWNDLFGAQFLGYFIEYGGQASLTNQIHINIYGQNAIQQAMGL